MIRKLLAFGLLFAATCWGQTVHTAGREVPNIFTATNQFQLGVQVGPFVVATLPAPVNGTMVFASDGTPGSVPCVGGGTGAFAFAIAGAWNCGGFGGGGTPGSPVGSIQGNKAGAFGGMPGSTIDFTRGLLSLAPVGAGVSLSITGDTAASDILHLYRNGYGTPVFIVDAFGDLTVQSNGATGGDALSVTPSPGFSIATFNDGFGNTQVYIDSIGNLGVNKGLYDTNGSLGTPGQIISSTGSQIEWINSGSGGASITVNGSSPLSSPVNFQNGSAYQGLTINATNPSGSNVAFILTGALANTGLANSSITIGGTSVSLGGSTSGFPVPGPIGATTPNTGKFTTLTETSLITGLTGFLYGNGATAVSVATSTQLGTLFNSYISGLTGCASSGYVYTPAGTDCVPSSGSITNALQYAMPYYCSAVSSNVLCGVPAPTGPNGIPEVWSSTPSGSAAQLGAWSIPGVGVDKQTGTTYIIPATDDATLITVSNSGAIALAGTNMLTNNYAFSILNINAGLATYTPASGVIFPGNTTSGLATQIIPEYWVANFRTDNTNTYMTVEPTLPAFGDCHGITNALTITAATGTFGCNTINGGVTSVNTLTGAVVIEGATAGQMAVSGGASAALTGAADMTYSTHTFATTTNGIFDWSAATGTAAFKVPINSTNTATAAGVLDFDSTNKNYHGYVNGADSIFLNIAAAPTNFHLLYAGVASGNMIMEDTGYAYNAIPFTDLTGVAPSFGSVTQYGIAYGSSATALSTTAALTANCLIKAGSSAAPGCSSVIDNATTVTTTDTGGYVAPVFVADGTTAGFFDLPQGTTSAAVAPCNTANSICFQAPTAVTLQLRVLAGTPATGFPLYTNSSGTMTETISATSGTLNAGPALLGTYAVNSVIASTVANVAGHFTNLQVVTTLGGTCSTVPVFNVFDGTSNTGSTVSASASTQTKGTGTSTSQTQTFAAGDLIGIYISTAGATCTSDVFIVSAQYSIP